MERRRKIKSKKELNLKTYFRFRFHFYCLLYCINFFFSRSIRRNVNWCGYFLLALIVIVYVLCDVILKHWMPSRKICRLDTTIVCNSKQTHKNNYHSRERDRASTKGMVKSENLVKCFINLTSMLLLKFSLV